MAQPRRRMRAAASPRPAGPPSAARRHLVRTPGLPGRGGAGGARGCREALRGPAAGLKSRGWPAEEEEEPAWRMKCPKPCEWGGGAAATALLFPARRGGGGPGRSPQLPSRLLRHIEGPGGCSHPGSGLRAAGPDPSGPSRAPRPIPLGPQPFAAPPSPSSPQQLRASVSEEAVPAWKVLSQQRGAQELEEKTPNRLLAKCP